MAPRIGFIGLGTMGAGMARNLAKAGLPLTVATHSPGKAQAFARELGGAVEAREPPEEVARRSDIVVSCLPDAPEVEEVHLGPNGTIRGAAPETVVVDCSTIDPDAARAIGAKLAVSRVAFLDAPVS